MVARISEASIAEGVRTIAGRADCDAVFVSCTSLRSMAAADALEREVAMPVVSSNIALLWHLLRLAGVTDDVPGRGSLFSRQLVAR